MSNAQLKDVEYNQDASNAIENMSERGEDQLVVRGDEEEEEEEQDEDGDVDFNPFLKEALSPEASSSISSEVEVLDVDVFESNGETIAAVDIDSLKLGDEFHGSAVGDFEHGEDEIVRQAAVSPGDSCEKELREYVLGEVKKRKSVSMSEPEIDTVRENENGTSSETDVNNEVGDRKLSNVGHSRNPVMDIDDEDAICKRTRARYSLASFTLDELETFLQETDDEDDLQNFDDDEEYKKFLTAVLAGGDDDGQADQVSENIDDEDEDNDADFEIEIEEALESDIDENTGDKTQKNDFEKASRRPQTRQNRRQKSSGNNLRKVWQQANRPLRHLVPIMPAPVAPFHAFHGRRVMPEAVPLCLSTSVDDGSINGFSPHQIGQLHCLIHEHLQLLIQVHSLCVLEPSRHLVASQVQGLISEMLCKRDQALSSRSVAYPTFCFRPPYIHPSVLEELPKVYPTQVISESSLTPDAERGSSSPEIPHLHNISPSRGRYEYVSNAQAGPFQTFKGISWFPSITGPLLSILDVAPLNLVGRYMDDVKIAVREYRRRHLEDTCDPQTEREPLFPLPCLPSIAEPSAEVSRETIPTSADMVPSSSPSHQPPKKTLAGTLVENSKKQSVALVPKEIVKVSQRFFPLFNTALFPRKPPPMSVVNRVLFTDAEDELLAMGLMEYNTDWEAIQQRFLPCKSKHQIFVRQKNRCSSKAPENPIKVVKRIKNSPLTADEQARIEEGLRIFNHDWMSVWKFMVPHRDPSLLPRQWRIALGTQKSYKFDAAKREKKRLYESKRRKLKATYLENWKTDAEREDYQTEIPGENISGDNSIDIEDEAYVHEAFLADWRPDDSSFRSSELPCSYPRENHLPLDALSQEATCIRGQLNNGSGKYQLQNNIVKDFPHALINSGHPYTSSQFTQVRHCVSNAVGPNPIVPDLTSKSSRAPYYMRPYRARRANSVNLIKLAPDLPPLNLPPSVRVISQSALQGYQYEPSQKVSNAGGGFGGVGLENGVSKLPNITKSGTSHNSSSLQHNITNSQPEDSRNFRDKCVTEEKGPESDLQMHPLLFQAPDGGRLPYYPLNCKTSTSFSFFPRSQPQVSLSLFHNPHKADPTVNCSYESVKSKETNPTSFGTDFHPLLQKTDDRNSDSVTANEKANELDLEIHLSSTSRMEKVIRHRDVTKHNLMTSTVSPLGVETQNIKSPYRGSCATTMSKLVSDAPVLAIPSNNDSGFSLENVGDRSLPEIVMEQEELSDSDEETGEPVEFECEEMADSEGEEEGSDSEQTAYIQNKESASYAAEKVATLADYDDPQCELRASDDHQGDVLISGKDGSPLTLGFTGHGKDITRSPPWLSLDSCAPGCPPHSKMKSVESIVGDGRATKDLDSSQPNRSCKKMTPSTKGATAPKHELDIPEQPSQAPPVVNQLRKPRTRSCRTNLNLNTEMTVESSDNDKFG